MTDALEHIGATPKTVWRVTWMTETGSGTAGPFDGPDEACSEAQRQARANHRCVITISPHWEMG